MAPVSCDGVGFLNRSCGRLGYKTRRCLVPGCWRAGSVLPGPCVEAFSPGRGRMGVGLGACGFFFDRRAARLKPNDSYPFSGCPVLGDYLCTGRCLRR